MKSSVPKVLQPISGREMVGLVVDTLAGVGFETPIIVVPPRSDEIRSALGPSATTVEQPEPLGTAHALSQARTLLGDFAGNVLVMSGDVPLVTTTTVADLTAKHLLDDSHITLLACSGFPSRGLGRIIRGGLGDVVAIVEEADLSGEQANAPESNIGLYCFKSPWLWSALDELQPSAKGEIYLTGLVELAVRQGHQVSAMELKDPEEGMGVNDGVELAKAREVIRQRINKKWLLEGVTVMEPAYIDLTVELSADTTIYPNTFLRGSTRIGRGCQIGPGSIIVDSVIGDGCRVLTSVIEGSVLEENVDVGPYSHLRNEAYLESGVHIGNFSEVKKSRLGSGTKMGHFSYLGDAWVGRNVNIGAGTVTCNYDGEVKQETVIGDGAFIGSDSMLVAPLRVGAGASTGAGSVVTKDVPAGAKVVGAPARRITATKSRKGRE